MKVSELIGAQLDYWVAMAQGMPADRFEIREIQRSNPVAYHFVLMVPGAQFQVNYNPSTDWTYAGPIIERQKITICAPGFMLSGLWEAFIGAGLEPSKLGDADKGDTGWDIVGQAEGFGETPLIAAMRAYVASIYGDEVSNIPS